MDLPIPAHLAIHFFLSLLVGGYLYLGYQNFFLVLVCLMSGFFIDLDHFVDYFYWAGLRLNFKEFFNTSLYTDSTKKVFVLLHGWEYLPIILLVSARYEKEIPGLTIALFLPYLFHLTMDQICSRGTFFSYFLIYRILHKFSLKSFSGSK